MRRKPGGLVPLEVAICVAAVDFQRRGAAEFHGYELAKCLADLSGNPINTSYGTLYRALGRLEKMGLLQSRWETPDTGRQSRPPRRLYELTALGETAAREAASIPSKAPRRARGGLAPA